MTGPGIYSYSTTPANNVQANTGVNWDEGMAPAAVNNSARQNMADLRGYANNPEWFFYGSGTSPVVTPVYVSGTSFKITGVDVSAAYHVGRRVKAVGSGTGTIYGTISAVAFSSDTTATVGWDSGSLTNETLTISIGPAIANFPVSSQRLSTRQVLTSGSSATYTTPAGARQLKVRMVGAGGGGGGGGSGASAGTNGGTGGDTIFNSIHAAGGLGGTGGGNAAANAVGGAGGSGGTGSANWRSGGQGGGAGTFGTSANTAGAPGGAGGSSVLGGGGPGAASGTGTPLGYGGGGGGGDTGNQDWHGGAGGGGGEYVELLINSPAATYTYTIGAAGTAGATRVGAAGFAGVVIVDEFY